MMMDMLRSKLFNAALGLVFATGLFAAPIATPPMAVAQPGSGTFVADDCAFDLPIGTYDGQKAPDASMAPDFVRTHAECQYQFLKAVAEDRPAHPDLADGLHIQAVMAAAEQSSAEGRWVKVADVLA